MKRMNSLVFASWALLMPLMPSLAAETQAVSAKPNIILILSDDVGLGDIGCCGGSFKTPRIDALAKSGLRFAQCYSAPLCGPSRCQLLTGRYPFRTGLLNNHSNQAIQPGKETMIPTVMKTAGYVTASVGKWGQMSFGPGEWGFDEYLVFPGSGRYWRDQTETYRVNGETKNLPEGAYLPDLMHGFLVDFITRHKGQPFFVYYPMSHIHGPIVPTPDSKPGADKSQLYADNVAYMDKLVGQLMDELDRQHLREKTLVMFLGDNGTAHFGVEASKVDGRSISGQKGTMLEGGSRVPCVANWKGVLPEGRVLNDLVDFSDFFISFAELAAAKLPEGVVLDGHSFVPQLRGETGAPRDWAYVQLGPKWYVREPGYKLTQSSELFDMVNAPFEEKPVSAEAERADAKAARTRLQAALDKLSPATGKTAAADEKKGKKGKKNKKDNTANDKPNKRKA
jgi:arylsulfatase A